MFSFQNTMCIKQKKDEFKSSLQGFTSHIALILPWKLLQFFSIALAQFLKQKLHSQSSKCIWQNSLYGSAQLHRSPSKGHISPKTVNSSFKTKSFSHINSQCPQNEKFLLDCCGSSLEKKKDILKALNTFAKIT